MGENVDLQRTGLLVFCTIVPKASRKPFCDLKVREAVGLALDCYSSIGILQQDDTTLSEATSPKGLAPRFSPLRPKAIRTSACSLSTN